MPSKPKLDTIAAHKYFSAHCFNGAWDLIEKKDRTASDDRLMVAMNQAAIYHWLCREDCDDRRLSVGYWQASRIQALVGNVDQARKNAEISLSYSGKLKPFYIGYAYEALARSELLAGNSEKAASHLERARSYAAEIKEKDERELLLADLSKL
jgi:hypothetical protein